MGGIERSTDGGAGIRATAGVIVAGDCPAGVKSVGRVVAAVDGAAGARPGRGVAIAGDEHTGLRPIGCVSIAGDAGARKIASGGVLVAGRTGPGTRTNDCRALADGICAGSASHAVYTTGRRDHASIPVGADECQGGGRETDRRCGDG